MAQIVSITHPEPMSCYAFCILRFLNSTFNFQYRSHRLSSFSGGIPSPSGVASSPALKNGHSGLRRSAQGRFCARKRLRCGQPSPRLLKCGGWRRGGSARSWLRLGVCGLGRSRVAHSNTKQGGMLIVHQLCVWPGRGVAGRRLHCPVLAAAVAARSRSVVLRGFSHHFLMFASSFRWRLVV